MQFLINPERRNEMKRLIVLSAVLALSIAMNPLGRAQGMGGMDMKGMDMGKDKKSEAKVHKGAGTVKDRALLGKFSQDKKVEFEFVEQESNYVITSVE